jgi:diguanylate cyclase (GGDEF)-like protein/PAS domain S-box-containing protein
VELPRGDARAVFELRTEALLDRHGDPIGRLVILRDVSVQRQAQEQLLAYRRQAEAQNAELATLHRAIEQSASTVVITDATGNIEYVNPRFVVTTGYTAEEAIHQNPRVLSSGLQDAEFYREMWTTILAGQTWHGEFRNRRKDGSLYWEDAVITPVYDASGALTHFIAVKEDITARKAASAELERLNHELHDLVEKLQSTQREVTLINWLNELLQRCQTVEEIYRVVELTLTELLPGRSGWLAVPDPKGQTFEIVCAWGPRSQDEAVFAGDSCWALRAGRPHEVADPASAPLCGHLSRPVVSDYLCQPLIVQGEVLGLLHLKAIAAGDSGAETGRALAVTAGEAIKLSLSNLRLREVLREQAIRDPLTGLYNRRFLDELLPRELRRAIRRKAPLSLAIADLDHFKRFNDTYGHQTGDLLLRQVGALLQTTLRAVDVVCRLGGEEFVIVLPDSPADAIVARLEELRTRARALRVEVGSGSVPGVSLSIGVAQAPDHGSTEEELLHAADHALYAAKRRGRDRVVVFEPA